MRLHAPILSFAAGCVAAIGYTLCAVAVAVAPRATTAVLSTVIHLDLASLGRPLTWGSFLAGLLFWWLLAAGALGLTAVLYNYLIRGQLPQTAGMQSAGLTSAAQ